MKQRQERAVGRGEGTAAAVKVERAGPPDVRLIWDGPLPELQLRPIWAVRYAKLGAAESEGQIAAQRRAGDADTGAPDLADNEELA